MNIAEYYSNYKVNKNHSSTLNVSPITSMTINDLYNDCLSKTLLNKTDVIAWHNMLMEYVNLPDAIYWIRYHESSGKGRTSNRHNNRRACYTQFADGFSYVFVSNFDAHEIFNMVSKGVVPTAKEFLSLMKSFSFPMHYDPSNACEESDISAFPHVGYHAAGVLTANRYYLAHISAVKSAYKMSDGSSRTLTKTETERLFPRGVLNDWTYDASIGKRIRKLNYTLTEDEKKLVKAHFLRFIDPLNYFLSPATKNEEDSVTTPGKNIGEFDNLTAYMRDSYISLYGSAVVNEFLSNALVPAPSVKEDGSTVINCTYGMEVKNQRKKTALKPNNPSVSAGSLKIGRYAKNLFEELLNNNKLTAVQIDQLKDKNYCSNNFKISFPILVDDSSVFDKKRYYKDSVQGCYICSQWVEKQRSYIDDWKAKNNF